MVAFVLSTVEQTNWLRGAVTFSPVIWLKIEMNTLTGLIVTLIQA